MGNSWRPGPFQRGLQYRVKRTVQSLREGEVLRYLRDGYSRYDNMTGYFFEDEAGQQREWDLYDDTPLESAMDFFEQLQTPGS